MTALGKLKYGFMKDVGAPALLGLADLGKGKRIPRPNPHFGPPLKCAERLKEIMTRHYYLSRYTKGAKPVAWVTSGAPVEMLRPFGFYTIYPENHGALCGARKMGPELCAIAEEHGYHPDLCSYARIDLGVGLSGKTPVGRLPKPDLLFASNNICQTVAYWYKALAHQWKIPLILFDTPYNFESIEDVDIAYMVRQLEEMIPQLDDADPLRSLAKVYSLVILNNNLNHRLNLMERLVGEYGVDGLVIHSARSCKPYSVGQYDIKRLLMERLGLLSVVIEADITDSRAYSEEQTLTRLEAFFEALEN